MLFLLLPLAVFIALIPYLYTKFRTPQSLQGKHILITGGSSGLGLALAKLVARKGANVTIVARNKQNLDTAVQEIRNEIRTTSTNEDQGLREKIDTQQISSMSCDLVDGLAAKEALDKVTDVWCAVCCAGAARPRLFIDCTTNDLKEEMSLDYFTALHTVHPIIKAWQQRPSNETRKVVFVSSVAGLIGVAGYTTYSAAKYAIRGLAETLQMEMKMYNIGVHIFYPGGIMTPGYEEEMKTKPEITKEIEKDDTPMSAEACAAVLWAGIEAGRFSIAGDLIGNIIRCRAIGATPTYNFMVDAMLNMLGWIALPLWRLTIDRKVRNAGGPSKK